MSQNENKTGSSKVQWGPQVLDKLVAPKSSRLSACLAPELELPELPDYYGSFYLNNIFLLEAPDPARFSIIVFIRRLTNAVRDYGLGRAHMVSCVAALQHSNAMMTEYLAALSYFESAVINAYLALMMHEAIGKRLDQSHPRPFQTGDRSPPQRLNAAYNAIKHFNSRIENGTLSSEATPVWLVYDGIEFLEPNGNEDKLRFDELAGLLRDLESDARYLSEEVYRLAHQQRSG